ncbi:MAG: hypothetical protein JOZ51_14340, partial [Chloroflexi bacterium]|nr:hypothetical protein [Chloroflexota bacterium]
ALCGLGRVAIAQADYAAAQHYYRQAFEIAQRVQAPPLLIESAAGALHLCLHTPGNEAEGAILQELLRSLRQHPAGTAEIKRYITSLLRDEQPTGAERTQNGNLERILTTVTDWLTGTLQPQPWSIQRAL